MNDRITPLTNSNNEKYLNPCVINDIFGSIIFAILISYATSYGLKYQESMVH